MKVYFLSNLVWGELYIIASSVELLKKKVKPILVSWNRGLPHSLQIEFEDFNMQVYDLKDGLVINNQN